VTTGPTQLPTPRPTLRSFAPPTLPPTPPPAQRLRVVDPRDGSTTSEKQIVIRGFAPPNSTITHDIPLAFDEHTTADDRGRWSFTETLAEGENVFRFRVGDDRATEVTLTVYFVPV
jgi:hypothetical protein